MLNLSLQVLDVVEEDQVGCEEEEDDGDGDDDDDRERGDEEADEDDESDRHLLKRKEGAEVDQGDVK